VSKQKSPQEKKRASYAHDRRNAFGQHDKASRRIVPQRKRLDQRAGRRAVHQAVAVSAHDDGAIDRGLAQADAQLARRWRKAPDVPLGEHVSARRPRGGAPNAKIARRLAALGRDIAAMEEALLRLRGVVEQRAERVGSSRRSPTAADEAFRRAGNDVLRQAERLAAMLVAMLARP
jgi:hypothetical protein